MNSGNGELPLDNSLLEMEQQLAQKSLPPVHEWHPERESSIDIRISRDGSWYYRGSLIQREAMVRLFSTVLRRDADAQYYLVTPVEKLRIEVDDAPFVATSLDCYDAASPLSSADSASDRATRSKALEQVLVFTTNVGDRVIADETHPLSVRYGTACDDSYSTPSTDAEEPSPYVLVRDQLPALISRHVWIELAELVVQRGDQWGVYSAGMFFALYSEPEC